MPSVGADVAKAIAHDCEYAHARPGRQDLVNLWSIFDAAHDWVWLCVGRDE
jgi:hypothetical protein